MRAKDVKGALVGSGVSHRGTNALGPRPGQPAGPESCKTGPPRGPPGMPCVCSLARRLGDQDVGGINVSFGPHATVCLGCCNIESLLYRLAVLF